MPTCIGMMGGPTCVGMTSGAVRRIGINARWYWTHAIQGGTGRPFSRRNGGLNSFDW